MGIACTPNVFQNHMQSLVEDLGYVKVYLDDLLVLSGGSFEDHLKKLKVTFQCLLEHGIRVNVSKCKFFATKVNYLVYTLTRDGIKHQHKKIESIKN